MMQDDFMNAKKRRLFAKLAAEASPPPSTSSGPQWRLRHPLAWRALQFLEDHREKIDTIEAILENLNEIKKGRPFAKIKAAASITNVCVEHFSQEHLDIVGRLVILLEEDGYTQVPALSSTVKSFIYDILSGSLEYTVRKIKSAEGTTWEALVWKTPEGNVSLIRDRGDGELRGLYTQGETSLQALVYSVVWTLDSDLFLSYHDESEKFSISPLEDPGPYVSVIGPEKHVERLKKYESSTARTVMLEGPSGVGKSVLARHIAANMATGTDHTLKITGKTLLQCSPPQIQSIVKYFQPSVFLIDDLELQGARASEEVLSMFEQLHVEGALTLITRMLEPQKKMVRGGGYVEGLRPGRVDEVITLHYPSIEDRKLILEYYYNSFLVSEPDVAVTEEIAEKTEGLTGAYLQELVRRIQTHGFDTWEYELEHLLYMAPLCGGEEEIPWED